ncbi:hypothetical protein QUA41_22080 [Microcoleus sp. Pol11C1]|uniref:hypothetical protein n=1 Tax=unclassified Microcoleus TaxID=2642155 RepID=UPI002FCF5879
MNHPFDLDIADLEAIDLDFEETLTDEESTRIGGGLRATTLALGEEGGGGIQCISAPCPGSEGGGGFPPPPPIFDPPVTTLAIGEEGGGPYTKAWFEGGGGPLDW